MKKILLTAALLTATVTIGTQHAKAELSVGDAVPGFEMVGSDGKTYTNEQFKGKSFIVIAWYPKAFTGG